MGQRNDPDMVVVERVYYEEGKSPGEISPRTIFTNRPALGGFAYGLNRSFNLGFKIEAKPRGPVFVVRDGLPKFHLSLMQYGRLDHECLALMSANTSAAGRPDAAP